MSSLFDKAKELNKSLVPESESIRANGENVRQYIESNKPAPATPATQYSPSDKEKVNPQGKYGDRPGEKRIDVSNMIKPLGSFKHGTDYVPKTGPYILHEGEKVTTREDNMKNMKEIMAGASEHMGAEHDKPRKEIDHIRTRKSKNGGYIHEHHYTHPEHYKPEEHVAADQDAMVDHMIGNMGEPNTGEAEADAGQSGIEGEQ